MNLYMHTLDGKPALYQPGQYLCYINSNNRVTSKQMFRTSLKQIYDEQRASALYMSKIGEGVRSGYGYIRIKVDELPKAWWVTNHDAPVESKRVSGPYTTNADAGMARALLERFEQHHNYWIEELEG